VTLKVLANDPQQMVLKMVIKSATAKVEGTNMYGGGLQTACEVGYTRETAIMHERHSDG
jgi:hypothetical protein